MPESLGYRRTLTQQFEDKEARLHRRDVNTMAARHWPVEATIGIVTAPDVDTRPRCKFCDLQGVDPTEHGCSYCGDIAKHYAERGWTVSK